MPRDKVMNIVRLCSYVVLSFSISILIPSCDRARIDERQLHRLQEEHASVETIQARLGKKFTRYTRGEPSWLQLQKFLERENHEFYAGVNRRATRAHEIMFHTTESTTTWIFIDSSGRMFDYEIGGQ